MNRRQRNKNRRNTRMLASAARHRVLMQHTCENCGEKGGHWISTRGSSLLALVTGEDDQEGFWTCPKLYGEDGRRLPEHTDTRYALGGPALLLAALLPNA